MDDNNKKNYPIEVDMKMKKKVGIGRILYTILRIQLEVNTLISQYTILLCIDTKMVHILLEK